MDGPTYNWDPTITSKLSPATIPYLTRIVNFVENHYQQQQWDGIKIRSTMSDLLLPYVRDVMFLNVGSYYIDLWNLLYQWLTGLSTIVERIGIHTIYWLFHPLPHEQMKVFHLQVDFHLIHTTIPLTAAVVKNRRKLNGLYVTLIDQPSRPFIDGMLACCYHFSETYHLPLWVTLDRVPLTLDDMIAIPHDQCTMMADGTEQIPRHPLDGTYQIQLTQAITVEGITGSWITFNDPTFLQGWLSYKKTCDLLLEQHNNRFGTVTVKPLPSGPGYWKLLVCQDGKWQDGTIDM